MYSQKQDSYEGAIKNGVVVLPAGVSLPEGTRVKVIPEYIVPAEPEVDTIYDVAQLAVQSGVPDLSRNIDHYLYGHPKSSQ
jgi:hypothetical protein